MEEKLSALRPHRTGRQNPKTPRVFLQAADITAGGWGLALKGEREEGMEEEETDPSHTDGAGVCAAPSCTSPTSK